MPIEIEKKYRLTSGQRQQVEQRLRELGTVFEGEDFEENTLFAGEPLIGKNCALRLRRVGNRAILTFKERFPTTDSIKRQSEDETTVGDADAMEAILKSLGFVPRLVYEKRRATWRWGEVEVVLDELPFGSFMEIEGTEDEILDVERKLAIADLEVEHRTYPQLANQLGVSRDSLIEARFKH